MRESCGRDLRLAIKAFDLPQGAEPLLALSPPNRVRRGRWRRNGLVDRPPRIRTFDSAAIHKGLPPHHEALRVALENSNGARLPSTEMNFSTAPRFASPGERPDRRSSSSWGYRNRAAQQTDSSRLRGSQIAFRDEPSGRPQAICTRSIGPYVDFEPRRGRRTQASFQAPLLHLQGGELLVHELQVDWRQRVDQGFDPLPDLRHPVPDVDRGRSNADVMANDADLGSLHGDPTFEATASRARSNETKARS